MLRNSGRVPPLVSSFHPLRNASASETRYDADPRDLIEAVGSLRARGARFSPSTTPIRAGPRSQVRPTCARTTTGKCLESSSPC